MEINPGLATDEQLRAVELQLSDQIVFEPRPSPHELDGSEYNWYQRDKKPPSYHSESLSPREIRSPAGTSSADVFETNNSFAIHELDSTTRVFSSADINYEFGNMAMYPPSTVMGGQDDRDAPSSLIDEESDMYGPS